MIVNNKYFYAGEKVAERRFSYGIKKTDGRQG